MTTNDYTLEKIHLVIHYLKLEEARLTSELTDTKSVFNKEEIQGKLNSVRFERDQLERVAVSKSRTFVNEILTFLK